MVAGRLSPLTYQPFTSKLLAGSLLVLVGISLGACFTDLVDSPYASAAFLDDGGVRSFVDGRWWLFGLVALLAYAGRVGFGVSYRQPPRALVWRVSIELGAVVILAGLVALGLSWLSVQYFPCVVEARCGA